MKPEAAKCIACLKPLEIGDRYYPDESGGVVHDHCVGPERESYTYEGEPLKDGQAIPEPYVWSAADHEA
jgi:hypothetical protein